MADIPLAVEQELQDVGCRLLTWYSVRGRRYPWRSPNFDRYQLAVAEILLQKTKALDAFPVWLTIIDKYPSCQDLAEASTDAISRIVGGLGLGTQRTRRLKAMASHLLDGGDLNDTPGLGPYGKGVLSLTAGLAGGPIPVDGNIARFITRCFGFAFQRGEARKKPEVRNKVRALLDACPPAERIALIYSLVDIGDSICRPQAPNCSECPLNESCAFTHSTP